MTDKAAILIDGGYYLRRLRSVRPDINDSVPEDVARSIRQLINNHLTQLNRVYHLQNHFQLLYRCFFYDGRPFSDKTHYPISKKFVDFSKSDEAQFRTRLFDLLRKMPNLALRLGEVARQGDNSWVLKPDSQRRLINGRTHIADLKDEDFNPNLRQKGVDMRIGLDIATITLKKQANIIVLVSGDSDFVPAAMLARREGATFILDPLWRTVSSELLEHIDQLRSGFYNPTRLPARQSGSHSPSQDTQT